jgi:hypothetical protein
MKKVKKVSSATTGGTKATGLNTKLSEIGLLQTVAGVGLGFLLVHFFALDNLLLWGWFLVGVALVGFFFDKMK